MFDHKTLEKKWQKKWVESDLYKTSDDQSKPKHYVLDMFPYPSGEGLHVGHPKGYIATDIYARMKMMQGFNVLHPMGWDAFGLPAENYALKNKVHPRVAVEKNIATFKRQLEMIGFTYDWSREVNTTDPAYYKWTQWAFLQMFKRGLAYESYEPINWCPSCKTGLANEDLEDGHCERCGSEIERKPMRQWVIKITEYAERLLVDLEKLPEWDASIKDMQRAWIGKSEGTIIQFTVHNSETPLAVFTTRVDTIFGCTYVVIAPEHPLVDELRNHIRNIDEVAHYVDEMKKKSDLQRTDLAKEKTGVRLDGVEAFNPFTKKGVPIFVADYVLNTYGTGAVMAVPAHDERDFAFAKKFHMPIKKVILPSPLAIISRNAEDLAIGTQEVLRVEAECWTEPGTLVDSGVFSGLSSIAAQEKMTDWLIQQNSGEKKTNYKIRDWVFSRQRYWGEPIPIIHCEVCGTVGVPEEQLPVILPEVEHYEPTGTGESPLANIPDWVTTTCPQCGGAGKRETNTMPQWAGSSWYYLRYEDTHNDTALVDITKEKYWSPIDFYVGGAEHATRHLIYARFWHKFLHDIGVVNYDEPFTRLQHVGLIMGEDGRKMSKRWGNVINPDDIIERFGADSLRVYEMFMGPFSQSTAWNTNGLVGARRFLEKVWRLHQKCSNTPDSQKIQSLIHKTIKKVTEDITGFRLNTAVSSLMILTNAFEAEERVSRSNFEKLLQLLSPFAPHLSEELWHELTNTNSIFQTQWPTHDPALAVDDEITIVIQVNGKMRDEFITPVTTSKEELEKVALSRDDIQKWIEGKEIKKVIVVDGKLVNIVTNP